MKKKASKKKVKQIEILQWSCMLCKKKMFAIGRKAMKEIHKEHLKKCKLFKFVKYLAKKYPKITYKEALKREGIL